MSIGYLLSSTFDYSRLICDDAGPQIAIDYDLSTHYHGENDLGAFDHVIVDPWIQDEELQSLAAAIRDGPPLRFLLKVTDPYMEDFHWSRVGLARGWGRFVEQMLETGRVGVVLTYTPSSATSYWISRFPGIKAVFMPYVYQPEMERPINHSSRPGSILTSGNRRTVYPVRRRISKQISMFPPLRVMAADLPHPGYDLSKSPNAVVRTSYIEHLAKFRFAVVCSSLYRLEFLKYREFAYAGVVPIGDLPLSMENCPKNAWISWRRNLFAMAYHLRTMEDSAERAEAFRDFMRKLRDRDKMRAMLRAQIASLGPACSLDYRCFT